MSSENSCRCVTEQNTRVQTIRDDVCRDIARYGEPYNPYKPPQERREAPVQAGEGDAGERRQMHPAESVPGSVVTRQARAQGTFPESPGYHTATSTSQTTLDM